MRANGTNLIPQLFSHFLRQPITHLIEKSIAHFRIVEGWLVLLEGFDREDTFFEFGPYLFKIDLRCCRPQDVL